MTFHAYVDESGSGAASDPNTYLLAASVLDRERAEEARAAARGLLLRGQAKVHWRAEDDRRRKEIISTVAEICVEHLVVVRNGVPGETLERRRRQCLERLFWEFEQMNVTLAVFESRGPKDDRRDRDMLDSARARKTVTGPLRIDHATGKSDPLLWIPDAVCGAVTRARAGEPAYLEVVEAKVHMVTIERA